MFFYSHELLRGWTDGWKRGGWGSKYLEYYGSMKRRLGSTA